MNQTTHLSLLLLLLVSFTKKKTKTKTEIFFHSDPSVDLRLNNVHYFKQHRRNDEVRRERKLNGKKERESVCVCHKPTDPFFVFRFLTHSIDGSVVQHEV